MAETPDYRSLSPPDDKPRKEYTAVERRAELYDLIEQKGHYRNLERSQRELGRQYDVSHTTIHTDIKKILEWESENLGKKAEQELSLLKTSAVKKLIDEGKHDKAYRLAKEHYQMLQDMGVKEKEPDKQEINIKDAWRDVLEDE